MEEHLSGQVSPLNESQYLVVRGGYQVYQKKNYDELCLLWRVAFYQIPILFSCLVVKREMDNNKTSTLNFLL